MWSFRTYTFYKKPTKFKVRPGSLGHLSLLYYKSFTVSILSNKFIVGIEHVKRLCYSNPRLLEPMPGGGGVHGMRGARGAVGGSRQNQINILPKILGARASRSMHDARCDYFGRGGGQLEMDRCVYSRGTKNFAMADLQVPLASFLLR